MTHYPAAGYDVLIFTPMMVAIGDANHYIQFEFARAQGSVGRFTIVFNTDKLDPAMLAPDNLIQFQRKAPGSKKTLEFMGFIRKWKYHGPNKRFVTIEGSDLLGLLDNHIVGYRAGSNGFSRTNGNVAIDSLMTQIVYYNLETAYDPFTLTPENKIGRSLVYFGFLARYYPGAATAITKGFAWRNVLQLLRELSDQSAALGSRVYFDIVPEQGESYNNENYIYKFETSIGVPVKGNDRTYSVTNPVLFSEQLGNLENPELTYDYSQEVNAVYVAGAGEETNRKLAVEVDFLRSIRSPWARREKFLDMAHIINDTTLSNEGKTELEAGKPYAKFRGRLKDTPESIYGHHWRYGDIVTVHYSDLTIDSVVDGVVITMTEDRKETIRSFTESVIAI